MPLFVTLFSNRYAVQVYRATYRRVAERNRRFYKRYPGDTDKVHNIYWYASLALDPFCCFSCSRCGIITFLNRSLHPYCVVIAVERSAHTTTATAAPTTENISPKKDERKTKRTNQK